MDQETVNHDGRVAKVLSDREVILNKGANDDIKEGLRFVVFSIGDEILDPNTRESLGCLELVKGKGEVVHVHERICTIETYEYDYVTQTSNFILGGEEKRRVYRTFQNVSSGDYARIIT